MSIIGKLRPGQLDTIIAAQKAAIVGVATRSQLIAAAAMMFGAGWIDQKRYEAFTAAKDERQRADFVSGDLALMIKRASATVAMARIFQTKAQEVAGQVATMAQPLVDAAHKASSWADDLIDYAIWCAIAFLGFLALVYAVIAGAKAMINAAARRVTGG